MFIFNITYIFQNTFDMLITENSTVSPLGRNSLSVSVKIGDFAPPEKELEGYAHQNVNGGKELMICFCSSTREDFQGV